MAVVKKKKAGGAGAANMGGLGITGDLNPGILQQLQQSLQGIQNNPTGGYTGGTTPPYQQPPPQGPISYPIWGPGPPPGIGPGPSGGLMGPRWTGGHYGIPPPGLGPGMRGIAPPGVFGGAPPQAPPQQPQPQMDWSGLMGKLQGILSPYLSGGTGTAAPAGGAQNPMQSVMGALMGSLGGYMNQMPSGAQSGGMDWQNLAKQIQNPTAGQGGTQGQLLGDIMGLMGQFNPSGQQQAGGMGYGGPVTGGDMGGVYQPYSLAGGTPQYSRGLGYSPPGSNIMAY